jgi:tRNA(Ile)-lysidine synthase
VGIALSGGGDSVALLHAACTLAPQRGFSVAALHVNHHWRDAADQDAAFCARLASEFGAAFHQADLDPARLTGNRHHAARQARYRELARLATAHELEIVLTAHTLDDQAETLLHRLMRGTGPTGLAGIRERVEIFGRPWLDVPRARLREYLQRHRLTWLDDPSNQDRRFTRARIRHDLLPLWRDVGGAKSLDALARLAELAAAERQVLDELAADDLQHCRAPAGLALDRLRQLSDGRRMLVLRRWLNERGLNPPAGVIADLQQIVAATTGRGPYRLPNGLAVRRDHSTLNWDGVAAVYEEWAPFSAENLVDRTFAAGQLRLTVRPAAASDAVNGFAASPSAFAGCVWRPSWPGARLQPAGLRGHVKCQDLFVNAKIPRALRAVWPVLARGDEVLLVPGLRRGAAFSLAPEGADAWVVELEWLR